MEDASGRSVAAPLRRGSPCCLFHARPFSTQPATLSGPIVVLYLDLEPVFLKMLALAALIFYLVRI